MRCIAIFAVLMVPVLCRADDIDITNTDMHGNETTCSMKREAVSAIPIWKNTGLLPDDIHKLSRSAYQVGMRTYYGDNKVIFRSVKAESLEKYELADQWVLIFTFYIDGKRKSESGEIFVCISPNGLVWEREFASDL